MGGRPIVPTEPILALFDKEKRIGSNNPTLDRTLRRFRDGQRFCTLEVADRLVVGELSAPHELHALLQRAGL